ncbi:neuraminidase-like domain-containing protein [Bradyrhizobium sp. CCBAU 53415]|uniref:Tc toxin subunit A-related protein n=1 Tax=Bradyrhizobium sp. CCBAU 53415 TaxID=1325119 RepID=UPI002304F75F|nr:neuraminidase-like domain-containing protein [Bradyrhizobium sp. CCBAU 53415]
MPQVILVRLVPMKPTSGANFSSYLTNLSIRAFDLSFGNTADGTLVGQAQGAWVPNTGINATGPAFTPATQRILQHFSVYPVQVNPLPAPPDPDVRLEAVATAVIELNPPAAEFNTSDLRLEIKQGTQLVAYERLDFNVKTEANAPISNNPTTYISVDPPALVVSLPDPAVALDPNAAFVDLPTDGTPPKFASLRTAVDKVLAQDPSGGTTLANRSPLTAAQARQIAREIIWNRQITPPPDRPNNRRLEDMYTRPQTDTSWSNDDRDKADMDRKQYEASLLGYYALQNANSDRLAQYVFAISAAVWAEQQSAAPVRASLHFPVETGTPPTPGSTFRQADVVIEDNAVLTLNFQVPADYFYALSAVLAANVTADQRYRMATDDDESRIISGIKAAIDANIIAVAAISPENAARRLVAIGRGRVQRPPLCPLNTAVNALVTAWLADMNPSIDPFWQQSPFPAALVPGHLDLVLAIVTQQTVVTANSAALIAAIKTIPVANTGQLKALTVQQWMAFFLPANVGLLPDFTNPGTPEERVQAFVRQVRKYFEVLSIAPAPVLGAGGGALSIPIAENDPFEAFLAAAPGFAFPVANWGAPLIVNAIQTVFPGDANAQAWLLNALQTIDDLLRATTGVGPASLQFSLLEALYARGFTSRPQIQALSPTEFEYALTGTVAYPFAAAIQAAAGGSVAGVPPVAPGPFTPINPDGSLVNCIPPWHLSPLGPVKYLHDLLATGIGTTCDHPVATGDTLGTLIASRRGPLGDLHATAADLCTTLPLIDIVNENLEALVDGSAAGVVYDTNGTTLGGHTLKAPDSKEGEGHAPNVLFAALPEYSTPATPLKRPGAYATLEADFSSPLLPYSQPLDVSRSYLCAMGTSRFATMRAFREQITEFAINANEEAVDFQKHLWRYPVRIELAIEYLGLSPTEYQTLYVSPISANALRGMYGFPADVIDGVDWKSIVVQVPDFLRRTRLEYCEFLELWKSKFVEFERQVPDQVNADGQPIGPAPQDTDFPNCEPCCPEGLIIRFTNPESVEDALRRLMVFIRLWRSLKCLRGAGYSFADLRDICLVLGLFQGANVDPEFIRQLVSFQILRDDWRLHLGTDPAAPNATGATRTRLLGLWSAGPASSFDWAIEHLLGCVEDRAEREHAPGRRPGSNRRHRPPEFMKILRENLDPLALLSGFDPATARWNGQPTNTLRFTEVLAKIYGSSFTTGELLYLFSVDQHLDGDDPFFQQDGNEALDQPFDLPEEGHPFDLWNLREKLLHVHAKDEDLAALTWTALSTAMRTEFGYDPPVGTDPLQTLGEHFFPETLARSGIAAGPQARQYRTALTGTVAGMWNFPHPGPFQYDVVAQELVTSLPLRDADVLFKLNAIEQLTANERAAVQQLYFAPRAELARFSFLFTSLVEAEKALIEEADEWKRWEYFRRSFVTFSRRARVIAEHLTGHVAYASDKSEVEIDLALLILRRLQGDENLATSAWERDDGQLPAGFTWARPTGGAFAALTGLTGTGLLGEVRGASGSAWPELTGAMSVFTRAGDEWNAPVPSIIPKLDFTLPAAEHEFALIRNGLALRETDGLPLAGAEGFAARWSGVLIVERSGTYTFFAGAPTPDCERPDFEKCNRNKWRVNLRRGQKTFRLLNYRWADEQAPDRISGPLHLKRGAYFINIDFAETPPEFDEKNELVRAHTGFTVKYQGPDTEDCIIALPIERLYRDVSTGPLTSAQAVVPSALEYLAQQYTSSLRDIRRTYQRAFKALLFCHRLRLSAGLVVRANVSEIEYMLSSAAPFAGCSYVAGAPFTSHRASLDFNFLPIGDVYDGDPERNPPAPLDARATPSVRRRQALFDWFERLYDYTHMRQAVRRHTERLTWLCFVEASNQQPIDPVPLLMDLGINMDDAPLVLDFYDGVTVDWTMLCDDRWAIRCWHASLWVRKLLQAFVPLDLSSAQPDVWAGSTAAAMAIGNANLTKFYRDGMIERVPRRYADLEHLNNLLRERGRAALLAWLAGMNRVPLPFAPGTFATSAKDIGALLLLDVEAGICEKASRIEEAITAVQSFVQRARLSQEPTFTITPEFAAAWDKIFATLRMWQACCRRVLYKENYVEWSEHERAIQTEAFRFLESELRRATLTAPEPGGMEYWSPPYWPAHPSLISLQHREPSHLKQVAQLENLGLMGRPERHARPSWLAPSQLQIAGGGGDGPPNPDGNGNNGPVILAVAPGAANGSGDGDRDGNPNGASSPQLPLWLQAAVRLGTRFLRIAAAGEPPASSSFMPPATSTSPCCCDCGRVHPSVMDEYYFWLVQSEYYDPTVLNVADKTLYQDADWGAAPGDMTSDWHRPAQLPKLVAWPTKPMVKLAWVRVHNGEFQTPRYSDDGAHVNPAAGEPQLEFDGREGDSLRFRVTNADALPLGYTDPSPWGFRYDIAPDTAVVLPEVIATPAPAGPFPLSLSAYPFFVYFLPGAPLEPSVYSTAMTVAATLRTHCRYEAALKWYELYFTPGDKDLRWATCRKPPRDGGNVPGVPADGGNNFPNPAVPGAAPHRPNPDANPNANPNGAPIVLAAVRSVARTDQDPCCDTLVRTDLAARQRSVVLSYLETLLQYAQSAMCKNSPEAYAMTKLRLDTLSRFLGERPRTIFGQDDDKNPQTVAAFVPRFPPLNPRLMEIYDNVVDQLDALHQCLTKARLKGGVLHQDTSYWGDDSVRRGWKTAAWNCLDDDGCCCPPSPYRFQFLLQRALETAGDVRTLGAELLAAFEKGDAEFLAAMRARHERQLQNLTEEIRRMEFREADWQVQALQKSKQSAQAKRQYYADLIANGLIPKEQNYQNLTGVSMTTRAAGNVVEAVGQVMNLIPDNTTGVAGIASSPVSVFQMPIGTKLAHAFAAAARILYTVADITTTQGGLALTEGGWDRREADWVFQVTVLDIEIQQIERQILGAERKRDAALRQLNNLAQQKQQAAEVQDFLRDKFTNHALYLFLQQEVAALHRQMFDVAWCWARQAQRAFQLERELTTQTYLPLNVWDGLHEGLLAGERLSAALRAMEKAYFDQNRREQELVTRLSVRLDFPLAFLQLKVTGACEIEIPEWRLDREYPGHYLRRVKAVSLTIPCVAGPYTGVHCKLTLLSSATRVEPTLLDVEECCPGECTCGCCERQRYEVIKDDPRMVKRYGATEAIATSTGQNDSGLFELNFRDERYLPFEYAGAVSRWRIELPIETNAFDIDTVSDLIFQLSYTAREGGSPLRRASWAAASCMLPGAGLRFFDWRQDFSDSWQRFKALVPVVEEPDCALTLRMSRSMFPYLPGQRPVRMRRVELWFEAQACHDVRNHEIEFVPGRECECDEENEECCERYFLTCVASEDWPCLFHGVIEYPFPFLRDDRPITIGDFLFPESVGVVHRAYLVCSYEAGPPERCLPRQPVCDRDCAVLC